MSFFYDVKMTNRTVSMDCPRDLSSNNSDGFEFKKAKVSITVTKSSFKVRPTGENEDWDDRGEYVTDVSCPFYSYNHKASSLTNCSNYIPPFMNYVLSCVFDSEIKDIRSSWLWQKQNCNCVTTF